MSSVDVKTLLLISSADKAYSNGFLFHCAKYWAEQGHKVLYISHEPMESLPYSIGLPKNVQNLENFDLINFMYIPTWQELLKHCLSIHLEHNPVSVIIVQELETYFISRRVDDHDHVSLICASLLQAASVCATKNSKTAYLINGFNSKYSSIPRTVTKSFFHNVWEVSVDSEDSKDLKKTKFIKLEHLSQTLKPNSVKVFFFSDNKKLSFLDFESVLKIVIKPPLE